MSVSNSSLVRYRSAILALAAVAVGCTIFYIRSSVSTHSQPLQPSGQHPLHRSNARRRRRRSRETDLSGSGVEDEESPRDGAALRIDTGPRNPILDALRDVAYDDETPDDQELEGRETDAGTESEHSWRDANDSRYTSKEGQSLLNLLFRIAEEQAKKDGYVHRGVTCNSCSMMPIQGIRYRCTNCADCDLCEQCEALQIHNKTHLFYKIRIPVPFLSNPREPQPLWYPGKPNDDFHPLRKSIIAKYCKDGAYQRHEVEALWEQFRCLAATEWLHDPDEYCLAIDRPTFDKCFIPASRTRPPPPNLIYDRMFAFYDTNRDGLIGFNEFFRGLSSLSNQKHAERRRKIFDGYDINDDGYVDRKDFLRMFRAFYALSKEMTKDVISAMDDDGYDDNLARQAVTGSQPLSSAFSGQIFPGDGSRAVEGKGQDENGDYVIYDHGRTVKEGKVDLGDHNEAVADAVESRFYNVGVGTVRRATFLEESIINEQLTGDVWPPTYANTQDAIAALGLPVPLEEIIEPADREKVRLAAIERFQGIASMRHSIRDHGIQERWERQQFYLANEDGALPPNGFRQDGTSETQPLSRRSRSSSKVRFQDDLTTEDEHETRSATSMSSRSIPLGERWGGYEVPEAEKDVGREVLYQVAQEGLNELLDPMFQQREDFAILVRRTKRERDLYRSQISAIDSTALREQIKRSLDIYELGWRNLRRTHPTEELELFNWLRRELNPAADLEVISHLSTPARPPKASYLETWALSSDDPAASPHPATHDPIDAWGTHAHREDLESSLTEHAPHPESYSYEETFPTILEGTEISPPEPASAIFTEPLSTKPLDPTLPQNRRNTSFSSSPSSSPTSPAPAHPTLPFPSRDRLRFLLAMDIIDADDARRGGPGRLSFSEFEELLMGDKGSALGFTGSWVEMASF